jgi:hypothetical protein
MPRAKLAAQARGKAEAPAATGWLTGTSLRSGRKAILSGIPSWRKRAPRRDRSHTLSCCIVVVDREKPAQFDDCEVSPPLTYASRIASAIALSIVIMIEIAS